MNYLVPIDFSDHSKTAAEYAAGLTRIWNGNVHLTHIIVPIEDEPAYLPVKTLNVKRNTVFEIVSYQENLRRQFGVRSSCDMLKGSVTTQIKKTASAEKSDLIVIGKQGLTGLRRFLYGSNTMTVIEESSIPVLVVPANATFKPYEHIVHVTKYDQAELEDVKALIKISRKLNSRLTLLSINVNASSKSKSEFISQVEKIEPNVQLTFIDMNNPGGIADGLQKFTRSHSVDLVSLSSRRQRLVRKIAGRSLTSDFVFQSHVPVLYFPR